MGKIFRSETLRAESSLPRFKDIGDKLDVKNSFLREPFLTFLDEAEKRTTKNYIGWLYTLCLRTFSWLRPKKNCLR